MPSRIPCRRSLSLRGPNTVVVATSSIASPSLAPASSVADGPWPSRNIHLIVPSGAGSTTDIVARLIAAKLSREFWQPFIVENKPGLNGNIAADYVAKSDPDGCTFLVGTQGIHAINRLVCKNMPFDPIEDIDPVIIIARIPSLVSVSWASSTTTLDEFIRLARAWPGSYRFGSLGVGSMAHLSIELFKSMASIDLEHVPHEGSVRLLTELMVGHIDVTMDSLAVSRIFAKSNRIRPIAVSSATRCPLMPDIPTMAEAGVSGYEAVSWLTIAAPAKTPPAVIGKLNESVARFIIRSPDGIQRLQRLGAEPAGGSPEDMRRYVLAETEKWGKVAKFAGIEPE